MQFSGPINYYVCQNITGLLSEEMERPSWWNSLCKQSGLNSLSNALASWPWFRRVSYTLACCKALAGGLSLGWLCWDRHLSLSENPFFSPHQSSHSFHLSLPCRVTTVSFYGLKVTRSSMRSNLNLIHSITVGDYRMGGGGGIQASHPWPLSCSAFLSVFALVGHVSNPGTAKNGMFSHLCCICTNCLSLFRDLLLFLVCCSLANERS